MDGRQQTRELEDYILKTNEPILMAVGTHGPLGRSCNGQVWRSEGQRSRSHEAKLGQTCKHDISKSDGNWCKWFMRQGRETIKFGCQKVKVKVT